MINKNQIMKIGEKFFPRPLIVTVCKKLENGGYLIGDYTGIIIADFSNLRR
jgi:hypothetical protein